jgi:phasin family protein
MINTYEKILAPIKELNELTFKSIEQITSLQLKAFQDNAKIGMYALNTLQDIKDLESFKTYLESQIAVTQYVSDNAAVDAQEIADLSKSFAINAKEVVEKTIIPQ